MMPVIKMVTLALVILCSAIFIFFTPEFKNFCRKLFSIPGVKLLLPLVFFSWLVEIYEEWGQWLLVRTQAVVHQLLYKLSTLMPFETGKITVIRIVYLFLLASIPLWAMHLRARHKKRRHPVTFSFYVGLVVWLIAAVLLSVA